MLGHATRGRRQIRRPPHNWSCECKSSSLFPCMIQRIKVVIAFRLAGKNVCNGGESTNARRALTPRLSVQAVTNSARAHPRFPCLDGEGVPARGYEGGNEWSTEGRWLEGWAVIRKQNSPALVKRLRISRSRRMRRTKTKTARSKSAPRGTGSSCGESKRRSRNSI